MKVCSICHVSKPLECFNKQSTGVNGRRADCKDCLKRFTRSEAGLVNQMYSGMKSRTKRKGFPKMDFSKEEFVEFLNSTNIVDLYDAWVESNYNKDKKPSVDRLDDYKGYSLDNIQITTAKENIDKYYDHAMQGINTKKSVGVYQYSLDGKLIKKHHSLSSAARELNTLPTNIRLAATHAKIKRKNPDGTYRTEVRTKCKGFLWKLEK